MHLAFVWNLKYAKLSRWTRKDHQRKICYAFLSSPETWTESQQNLDLSCPFHYILSEKTEMWSAQPLLPLARLNVYNQLWNTGSKLPWSTIVKEPPRRSQLQLETAALRWFAFFFFGCPQSLPFLGCFVFCAGEGTAVTQHQALHSRAVWHCRFLTLGFSSGAGGPEHQCPSCVLTLKTLHVVFTTVHVTCTCKEKVDCLTHHNQLRVFADLN